MLSEWIQNGSSATLRCVYADFYFKCKENVFNGHINNIVTGSCSVFLQSASYFVMVLFYSPDKHGHPLDPEI
jgi:hypothetical protein